VTHQVWLAFCKWIVERFDKGKGVCHTVLLQYAFLMYGVDSLEMLHMCLATLLTQQPFSASLLSNPSQQPFSACLFCAPLASGVTIINFIRLSWEQDDLEKEIYGEAADRALRPVWRMTEGFERAYTLQVRVCPHVPVLFS
jgi:hypothetical protein